MLPSATMPWLLALVSASGSALSGGTFFPANSPDIRYVNRFATTSNGTAWADWSSATFEFRATGPTSLRIAEAFPHGNEYWVTFGGAKGFQLNTNRSNTTARMVFIDYDPGAARWDHADSARGEDHRVTVRCHCFSSLFAHFPLTFWSLFGRLSLDLGSFTAEQCPQERCGWAHGSRWVDSGGAAASEDETSDSFHRMHRRQHHVRQPRETLRPLPGQVSDRPRDL